MEKGKAWCLRIERLRDGGYVVLDHPRSDPMEERFKLYAPLYACTTIDEALSYIKTAIEPVA